MVFAATPLGIGFSLFVVGLAAFNLLLDFDFIEKAAQSRAPKYMEWYGALRVDGHLDLAVPGDPPFAVEAGRSARRLTGSESTRLRSVERIGSPLTRPLRCLDSGL